ncbi:uncharacterized protein V2V93DRAFT_317499, partial [Kockiozyma suomiensis]|uniref:uncharacterized protein n=1 Tax=Kockiozyma suomiensis TaxID=1337062 RepID=UPI00334379E3
MRLEHIRRFEHEMHLLAEQQRKDEQMLLQMAAVSSAEHDNGANTATTISEPNTPPDFRDSISPPALTSMPGDRIRSNTVPVGVFVTPNGQQARLSGQQLMTPPDDALPRTRTLTSTSIGPSRRLSNDDPMFYSSRMTQADVDQFSLGQINTAKFLFGDETHSSTAASSAGSNELKFNTTDDKFPILIRRKSFGQPQQQQHQQPLAPIQPSQHQQNHQPQHQGQQQRQWSFANRNRVAHHQSLSGI